MVNRMRRKLRKMRQKIYKVRKCKWSTLSTGEKVLKVLFTLLKIAAFIYLGAAAIAIVLGIYVALSLMSGMAEAVDVSIQSCRNCRQSHRYYYW